METHNDCCDPHTGLRECPICEGAGSLDGINPCSACEGDGEVTCCEPQSRYICWACHGSGSAGWPVDRACSVCRGKGDHINPSSWS